MSRWHSQKPGRGWGALRAARGYEQGPSSWEEEDDSGGQHFTVCKAQLCGATSLGLVAALPGSCVRPSPQKGAQAQGLGSSV